jgi:GntR family transcriptional repressor for pyruvate dehydrogenase complex
MKETFMRAPSSAAGQYKAGSTAEVVLGKIRRMIDSGELKLGDRLLAERDLAKRFKISRASLRAALHSIAGMGLLQFRHGSGTYIKSGPPELSEGPLSLLARLHGFSDDEMFEARLELEVGIAALAALRATPEDIDELGRHVDAMQAALKDPQEYLKHDVAFHRTVAAASKNPILAALVQMVASVLYEERRETVSRARDLARSVAMHRRIYRAIAGKNPKEARDAMSAHLRAAQRARKLESTPPVRKKRTSG